MQGEGTSAVRECIMHIYNIPCCSKLSNEWLLKNNGWMSVYNNNIPWKNHNLWPSAFCWLLLYSWLQACVCDGSGAAHINFINFNTLTNDSAQDLPQKCAIITCQGYETSLAECVIHSKETLGAKRESVAAVKCYEESQAPKGLYLQNIFRF